MFVNIIVHRVQLLRQLPISRPKYYEMTNHCSRFLSRCCLSMCAASLGCLSRVKTPFLLPATLLGSCLVMKSAKFQMCSPEHQTRLERTLLDSSYL